MTASISVVITLYNKANYIGRALNSVFSQTTPCQEIIVVDDGSTDRGVEVVQAFQDSRVSVIRQQNQGVNTARNQGIAAARGDLIALLDADDQWQPRFLETVVRLARKFPQAGAFATNYQIVTPGFRVKWCRTPVLPEGSDEGLIENYFRVGSCKPVHVSAVAIPRAVLLELGGFLERVLGADMELFLRIALRYPIAWSKEPLAVYYENVPLQISRTPQPWPLAAPPVSKTARTALAANLVSPDQADELREYAAFWQVNHAIHCLERGNPELASHLLELARGSQYLSVSRGKIFLARLLAALPGNGLALYRKVSALEGHLRLTLRKCLCYFHGKE
jgi:cellulose synthase/poly-beta-1,6-N-acetylglucosamine synthase-like glycosyltransferase